MALYLLFTNCAYYNIPTVNNQLSFRGGGVFESGGLFIQVNSREEAFLKAYQSK